jgi:transcription antitermination factor NusG
MRTSDFWKQAQASSMAFDGYAGRRACPADEDERLSEIAHKDIILSANGPLTGCPPEKLFMPKWFAVYTSPRHEKRVAQYLNVREIEHYLPLYHPRHRWSDGSTVTLDLPLFPGYIFVRIDRTERVRVLEVPGVLKVVGGTGRQPAALPDAEIDALRSGLSLRRAEPHPLLTIGQRARIRSGALAGMEGVVVRQKGSLRVVLTVDLIMQSIAVEVDGTELEPLDSEAPGSALGQAAWSRVRTA